MTKYIPKTLPPDFDFESKNILKALAISLSKLSELKGFVNIIPNQSIFISSLTLQEAKDSSAIENIITTHDEIFKAELQGNLFTNPSIKEVQNYAQALSAGFQEIQTIKIIKNSTILEIQSILEQNNAGYRKLPGTSLKNDKTQEIIYTPPQDKEQIQNLMFNLVNYINDDTEHLIHPLIKMAIIHFQFESIHPFYDGNGRTGRILNILYLVLKEMIDIPVLYLSRFIIQNKSEYYKRIQAVRDNNEWESWIIFMLKSVEYTAQDTIYLIKEIKQIMQDYKHFLKNNFQFYSQDLLNNLFKHPYTKIDFLKDDLKITRQTASKYLNEISEKSPDRLKKVQVGKFSYFVNVKLFELFSLERDLMLKNS